MTETRITPTGESACLDWLLSSAAQLPSPCFVLDEARLLANVKILDDVQRESGAKILLALKAYAAWSTFSLLSRAASGPLFGTCASSVDEARLGREEFGGEVHAFAAAWSDAEMRELLSLADHIVFNSLEQWRRFRPMILEANAGKRQARPIQCGLRLNPEHSEGATAIYNPCDPRSRLGIRARDLAKFTPADLEGISGLHFHTLCEQGADALQRTLEAMEQKFGNHMDRCSWLNFGGGHHITKPGYDRELLKSLVLSHSQRHRATIYLEPGEAVALDAGWLYTTVLDVVEADMPVAILDTSAACHMPDVLEMPYTPPAWIAGSDGRPEQAAQPRELAWTCRLAGKSCLAGDHIGEYSFPQPLQAGMKVVFGDMAIYSMVKTTTFNGLRLPAIGIYGANGEFGAPARFKLLRTFGYDDFRMRLS